ncbi:MAG: glycerol kinase GlpK [Cyanobacteria bacterium P01_H01_bin.130]
MGSFILALDQGTTSSRAIVFNRAGAIQAIAQQEFPQIFPQSGWVEHDPDAIWSSQKQVVVDALAKANLSANDIAALGITNQRETTILWDRDTGDAIANGIVWQDRRTAQFIDGLKARDLGETFRSKTGLVLDAYFSGSKLAWLLDNVPGAREKADAGKLAFGTVDSWLVYKLTGGRVHVTDVSNACRTLMFNITTLDWDDDILQILNIPRSLLPEIKSCSEIYGETDAELFGAAIPIAGIAGDQQAATFGQSCFETGQGKNTYGTGCFMVMNTGRSPMASKNQLLTTVAWQRNGTTDYALEGSIFVAGALVQWLRDGLGIINTASEVEALAESVPDTGDVYLVPALAGLGAPHWDQYARGTIVGISRGTTAGHIARAALEGIAFQVADVVKAMESDSGIPLTELRVDGGATANNLLMQIQADILGVPVVRPKITETTALGAAFFAGLAVDYWSSPDEITELWQEERRFEPAMDAEERDRRLARWQKAIGRSQSWVES